MSYQTEYEKKKKFKTNVAVEWFEQKRLDYLSSYTDKLTMKKQACTPKLVACHIIMWKTEEFQNTQLHDFILSCMISVMFNYFPRFL